MSESTVIAFRAFLFLLDVGAWLGSIEVSEAFSVFGVVIVGAMFMVVVTGNITRLYFEVVEIEMLNRLVGTLTMVMGWN